MVSCILGGSILSIRLIFPSFDQTNIKNKQTRTHIDRPFYGDSLIESTIRLEVYIPYPMMVHTMCYTLLIVSIIIRYYRLKYVIKIMLHVKSGLHFNN